MEGDLEAMFMIALWLLILVGLFFLVKYFAEAARVDLDFSPKVFATLMDSSTKGENAFKKSKQESPIDM